MTNEEALTYVHGEMTTIRDGDVTHQSIQTNLADVICGGTKTFIVITTLNLKIRHCHIHYLWLIHQRKEVRGHFKKNSSFNYSAISDKKIFL